MMSRKLSVLTRLTLDRAKKSGAPDGYIICQFCGREFAPTRSAQKFCSASCRVQGWHMRTGGVKKINELQARIERLEKAMSDIQQGGAIPEKRLSVEGRRQEGKGKENDGNDTRRPSRILAERAETGGEGIFLGSTEAPARSSANQEGKGGTK